MLLGVQQTEQSARRGEHELHHRIGLRQIVWALRLPAPASQQPDDPARQEQEPSKNLGEIFLDMGVLTRQDVESHVAAKAEVHGIIRDFAREGRAAIVISSEVEGLLAVCDRVIVMSKGQVTATLVAEEVSKDAIVRQVTNVE